MVKKGDVVRIWWMRGCGWSESDYPRGRKATVVDITETGGPGVIGSPDGVSVRWLEGPPGIAYTVRSMVRSVEHAGEV